MTILDDNREYNCKVVLLGYRLGYHLRTVPWVCHRVPMVSFMVIWGYYLAVLEI